MENTQYYTSTAKNPYHLSVGVVVTNNEGKVACHHMQNNDGSLHLYILARETLKTRETLETAARRAMVEELMIDGEIKKFLGTITGAFPREETEIEKTTIYFLCKFKQENKSQTRGIERHFKWITKDTIEWHKPLFLIEKMEEQENKFKRTDLNESKILKRL